MGASQQEGPCSTWGQKWWEPDPTRCWKSRSGVGGKWIEQMLTVPNAVHTLVPVRELPPLSGLPFFCTRHLLILILTIFSSRKPTFALKLALNTLPHAPLQLPNCPGKMPFLGLFPFPFPEGQQGSGPLLFVPSAPSGMPSEHLLFTFTLALWFLNRSCSSPRNASVFTKSHSSLVITRSQVFNPIYIPLISEQHVPRNKEMSHCPDFLFQD